MTDKTPQPLQYQLVKNTPSFVDSDTAPLLLSLKDQLDDNRQVSPDSEQLPFFSPIPQGPADERDVALTARSMTSAGLQRLSRLLSLDPGCSPSPVSTDPDGVGSLTDDQGKRWGQPPPRDTLKADRCLSLAAHAVQTRLATMDPLPDSR